MEEQEKTNSVITVIRAVTRSLGLLIPLTAICIGIFTIESIQDTLVGGVIGILGTAGIFYFEGKD